MNFPNDPISVFLLAGLLLFLSIGIPVLIAEIRQRRALKERGIPGRLHRRAKF
jgi:hypothetical protein